LGGAMSKLIGSVLWQDLTVTKFYRAEYLYWYILASGLSDGKRWDMLFGPFDYEPGEDWLDIAKKDFMLRALP
jgi:hypothetical protein